MDTPRPTQRLAGDIAQTAAERGVELETWERSKVGVEPTMRTTAVWNDPVCGRVQAAVVVRDGKVAACEWGLVADAERPWTHRAISPCLQLGFAGEGVCDPSGTPITDQPMLLPVEYGADNPELLEAMLAGIGSIARTVGILVVSIGSSTKALDSLAAASWPGLITITVIITEDGRRALNKLLPARPVPAGGSRFLATSCDGLDDVQFGKSIVRRPSTYTDLTTRALAARSHASPTGIAAEAAALLPAPAPPAEPAAPMPSDIDKLRRQIGGLEGELAETRRQRDLKTQALTRVERERAAAQAEADRLRVQAVAGAQAADRIADLENQLHQALSDRDRYQAACEEAEADRDAAVRDRGRLALRLAATSAPQAAPGTHTTDDEPPSFRALFADAADRYDGLILDAVDLDVAAGLDQHPNAAAWRRKTCDALATLNAYAQTKRAARAAGRTPGPDLADVLAFTRSGGPGVLISANTIAMSESGTIETGERYRQARIFPVRAETEPSGYAYHGAHIKIERFKPPAPRLHFYDDTDGPTCQVYIGYCGPHLISPRTN